MCLADNEQAIMGRERKSGRTPGRRATVSLDQGRRGTNPHEIHPAEVRKGGAARGVGPPHDHSLGPLIQRGDLGDGSETWRDSGCRALPFEGDAMPGPVHPDQRQPATCFRRIAKDSSETLIQYHKEGSRVLTLPAESRGGQRRHQTPTPGSEPGLGGRGQEIGRGGVHSGGFGGYRCEPEGLGESQCGAQGWVRCNGRPSWIRDLLPGLQNDHSLTRGGPGHGRNRSVAVDGVGPIAEMDPRGHRPIHPAPDDPGGAAFPFVFRMPPQPGLPRRVEPEAYRDRHLPWNGGDGHCERQIPILERGRPPACPEVDFGRHDAVGGHLGDQISRC